MSICRLCPNETLYGSTFCLECEAKYERIKHKKGPPAPITTAPFDIYVWAEFEELKRECLRRGKTVEQAREAVYKRAKEMQDQYDIGQYARAMKQQREAEIAQLAERI